MKKNYQLQHKQPQTNQNGELRPFDYAQGAKLSNRQPFKPRNGEAIETQKRL